MIIAASSFVSRAAPVASPHQAVTRSVSHCTVKLSRRVTHAFDLYLGVVTKMPSLGVFIDPYFPSAIELIFPTTLELGLPIGATNISLLATMATGNKVTEESERAAYLLDAQTKAAQLFEEIERDLIRPGISEKTLSDEIHELDPRV